jgi:hypothetical protein
VRMGEGLRRRRTVMLLGLVIVAGLATARLAKGARPLVTDDARIVDPGACQLETWTRLGDAGDEYWALPACSPIANLELTAGVGVLPAEHGGKPEHASVSRCRRKRHSEASARDASAWAPARLQIDATYGRRIPDGVDDEWATVGLRFLSPQLFQPFGDLGAAVRRVAPVERAGEGTAAR